MKKNPFKYWSFTPTQLFSIIVVVIVLIIIKTTVYFIENKEIPIEYVVNQKQMNRIQKEIDSLYKESLKTKIFPFNPNYISKEKAFQLEMSMEEYQRLQKIRTEGKFVNSKEEFQKITLVSDKWMLQYAPYFKFSDWVEKKQQKPTEKNFLKNKNIAVKDLNKATKQDLLNIKGVGETTANKILSEREQLGGFVSMKQLDFIYGIFPEGLAKIKESFTIRSKPQIQKIDLQTASIEELTKIPYINKNMARQIVIERSKKEEPLTKKEFEKIKGLPSDKIEIIVLYLTF